MNNIFTKTLLAYLRVCAKLQLKKHRPYIIGVSGSAGKTSTMHAVYAILKDYKKCKYSKKANSHTGIPLDILDLHPKDYTSIEWIKLSFLCIWKLITYWEKYDIYVVELGVDDINEPKNMKYLLKILVPDIAIYLNVNSVHGANYENKVNDKLLLNLPEEKSKYLEQIKDLIAKDKNLLIQAVDKSGLVVLNSDDPRVLKSKELASATTYLVKEIPEKEAKMLVADEKLDALMRKSVKEETTIYYSNTRNQGGFAFDLIVNSKLYTIHFPTLILPKHFAVTFASALAIAYYLKLDMEGAIESLIQNFEMEPGRSTIFKGIHNSIIIDSSYNSSKESCMDMLDLLSSYKFQELDKSQKKKPYRIAVLGDMRELGTNSRIEHEDLANIAFDKADEFFLVGVDMKNYFIPKLLTLGINKYKIHWFDKAGDVAKAIKKFFSAYFDTKDSFSDVDDFYSKYIDKQTFQSDYLPVILVKGSQNTIFLEIVVEQLLNNPLDKEKLCRRGKIWDKQRVKYI
ncbi:MAG: Mur ligase family protein [bacterium]